MLNDVRYAVRMLAKSPGFTVAALVALAVGVGATTAMFTAINAVLLRPLPYPGVDRLFLLRETRAVAGFERTVVAEGEFLRWTRDHPLVERAAVVTNPGLAVRFGDVPERVSVLQVAADFFPLFGVTPIAGRAFGRDAEQPGHADVMLVAYDTWQTRLGGAADVVGRSISVEGRPTTIIGILPPRFTFGGPFEAIMPMTLGAEQAAQFVDHSLDLYLKLAPGLTPDAVQAELTRRVLATPESAAHATGAALLPLQEQVVGGARAPMLVLFGAVGLVLLIACANIANLLLARAAARQREMAVRSALGATRGRVLRQLVTESLLLSTAGGTLGSLLALWLSDVFAGMAAASVPRAAEIDMDGRALAFALATSGLCGLLFGLAPAWQASRPNIGEALKQETRGGSAAGRRRLLAAFAVSEIALALVLLVGAALLLTTFRNLRRVDAGFDPARVVTAPAYLPDWKYPTPEARRAFFREAVAELGAVPGVASAAAVNVLPLSGNNSSGSMTPEGWRPATPTARESADRRAITPAYFDTMGIGLLRGRTFTSGDDERAPRVAIVSRSLADRYWPGEEAVGKRLKLARYATDAPWLTVVGVAVDVRHATLAAPSRQVVYFPHAQAPESGMVLVARSAGRPGLIVQGIRQAMARVDPELPMDAVEPMTAVVAASLANQQLEFGLLGAFAGLAVLLAAAGIYGVMAYGIVQRTQEFGIRLALGATGHDIVRLVAWQGLALTAIGITIGLTAAWLASSVLSPLLFGVRPTDPYVYAGTALVLAAIALASGIVPARRALAVDPLTALRG